MSACGQNSARLRTQYTRGAMSVPRGGPEPVRNRLLALLPQADRARLLADTEPVELRARQVLFEQGEPVRHVYFPLGGLCSLAVVMGDGRAVEASVVGTDGLVGLPVVLGGE